MNEIISSIILWASLLISQWQNWISGGGIGGFVVICLYLIERMTRFTMSKKWYAFIFIVCFIVSASFMVWHEEHKNVVLLSNKIDKANNNKKIVADLSVFLSQATVIQMHCEGFNADHSPVNQGIDTYAEFKDWNERLHRYLKENIDHSYELRLEDNSGNPVMVPLSISPKHRPAYTYIEQRKNHLREFIKKYDVVLK